MAVSAVAVETFKKKLRNHTSLITNLSYMKEAAIGTNKNDIFSFINFLLYFRISRLGLDIFHFISFFIWWVHINT